MYFNFGQAYYAEKDLFHFFYVPGGFVGLQFAE